MEHDLWTSFHASSCPCWLRPAGQHPSVEEAQEWPITRAFAMSKYLDTAGRYHVENFVPFLFADLRMQPAHVADLVMSRAKYAAKILMWTEAVKKSAGVVWSQACLSWRAKDVTTKPA